MIDNILELDGIQMPHLDLTIWQIHHLEDLQSMITGALRSHPDWLIVAESRGVEFKEVLRSVKTGHPIITTLHSDHIDRIYSRMTSMLLIGESVSLHAHLLQDVTEAFPILIQLETFSDTNGLQRRIKGLHIHHHGQLYRFDEKTTIKEVDDFIQSWES